jgi:hypothetical protein
MNLVAHGAPGPWRAQLECPKRLTSSEQPKRTTIKKSSREHAPATKAAALVSLVCSKLLIWKESPSSFVVVVWNETTPKRQGKTKCNNFLREN